MSLARYAFVVVALVCGSLGVLLPFLREALDPKARWAAVLGGALAGLNTLAAYSLVLWSARRSTNSFLSAVLGGMLGRMAALLAAVVAAILWLGVPKLPLAVSLLSYFVVFLVFELAILQRRTTPQAEAR